MTPRADPTSKISGEAILVIFGSYVSLRVHYCKRDEAYFTTLLRQINGRQNGLASRMLFSELYNTLVNKVIFLGFRGTIAPPWIRPWMTRSSGMTIFLICNDNINLPGYIAFGVNNLAPPKKYMLLLCGPRRKRTDETAKRSSNAA